MGKAPRKRREVVVAVDEPVAALIESVCGALGIEVDKLYEYGVVLALTRLHQMIQEADNGKPEEQGTGNPQG